MKLALYQMHMAEDSAENLQNSLAALAEAAQNGADLIVYPELQLPPSFPQYSGLDARQWLMTEMALQPFREACKRHRIMAAPNFYLSENGATYVLA